MTEKEVMDITNMLRRVLGREPTEKEVNTYINNEIINIARIRKMKYKNRKRSFWPF